MCSNFTYPWFDFRIGRNQRRPKGPWMFFHTKVKFLFLLVQQRTGCAIVSTGSGEFFMVTAQFLQTRLAALLIELATVSLITVILNTRCHVKGALRHLSKGALAPWLAGFDKSEWVTLMMSSWQHDVIWVISAQLQHRAWIWKMWKYTRHSCGATCVIGYITGNADSTKMHSNIKGSYTIVREHSFELLMLYPMNSRMLALSAASMAADSWAASQVHTTS